MICFLNKCYLLKNHVMLHSGLEFSTIHSIVLVWFKINFIELSFLKLGNIFKNSGFT
jgi:hypothetical protein